MLWEIYGIFAPLWEIYGHKSFNITLCGIGGVMYTREGGFLDCYTLSNTMVFLDKTQ